MNPTPPSDTITAVATPPGPGGVGILRISGESAHTIATTVSHRHLENRKATFCGFHDHDQILIDQGIALYFKAPHSYTGEDVVELQTHGSPAVLSLLLERVLSLGARLANPGEFSRRAFLNGKHDLAQVAAIADLISSASAQAARSAQRVLQGEFSKQVVEIEAEIKNLRALIEASLDFPTEEIEVISDAQIRKDLDHLIQKLDVLQQKTNQGERLAEGLEIVIAGQPNVGKSSLLNRLSQQDTAIVNAQAGTTRDIVKSHIVLDGIPMTFLDTAGLRPSSDGIEQEGVKRSHQAMANADLVIVLIDATQDISTTEQRLLNDLQASNTTTIIAHNKSDLLGDTTHTHSTVLYISAKTGSGIDALSDAIKQAAGVTGTREDALTIHHRCRDEMHKARALLEEAQANAKGDSVPRDTTAHDLRTAHQTLATMMGEYGGEELLGDIFSRFCIGK